MITARDYRAGTSAFDLRQGPSAQRDIFTRNAGLGSLTANGGVGESRTMDMPPPIPIRSCQGTPRDFLLPIFHDACMPWRLCPIVRASNWAARMQFVAIAVDRGCSTHTYTS